MTCWAIPLNRAPKAFWFPWNVPAPKSAARDFLDHFFYNTRSEYVHQQATFSGLPTLTGVVDREPGPVADPEAIPFPGAFQPHSGHFYSSMNWGTQGWLSPRINTHFSLRYRQDLSALDIGSPARTVVNTFSRNRLFELTTGVVELNGLTRQGTLADSTLRLGRQNIYGAEMATVDGFSFALDRPKYRVSLFGGRRFTYYSDPRQRAIGGGSLGFRLPGGGSFEYQGLFYVKGIHRFRFSPAIGALLDGGGSLQIGRFQASRLWRAPQLPAGRWSHGSTVQLCPKVVPTRFHL